MKHFCLVVCCVVMLNTFSRAARAAEPPATVEEAIELRDDVMREIRTSGKAPPWPRAHMACKLLTILDSPDKNIRAVAIETFPKIRYILNGPCSPYLAVERPLSERIALLTLCVRQFGEFGKSARTEQSRAKVRAFAKDALNSDICPPGFVGLVVAFASRAKRMDDMYPSGIVLEDFVAPGNSALIARRMLALLGKFEGDGARRAMFRAVQSLKAKDVGPVIVEWYRTEADPAVRGAVLDRRVRWLKEKPWPTWRKALLELAAKDWHEENAKAAKKLLAGDAPK